MVSAVVTPGFLKNVFVHVVLSTMSQLYLSYPPELCFLIFPEPLFLIVN